MRLGRYASYIFICKELYLMLINLTELEEIRFHGRGGQGVVALSELIAEAAVREGKFARAFPWFGSARRGAPVLAFLAIGSKDSMTRSMMYNPKYVIVLDPALHTVLPTVTKGIKKGGIYMQNSAKDPKTLLSELNFDVKLGKLVVVDATKKAMDLTGSAIPNIVTLGSFVRATGLILLETATEVVKNKFPRMTNEYVQCLNEGYEKVSMEVFE